MITYDEWHAELERVTSQETEGAKSVPEWAESLHWSQARVRSWLRAGVANGWVQRVLVPRENLAGRVQRYPCYRILEQTC